MGLTPSVRAEPEFNAQKQGVLAKGTASRIQPLARLADQAGSGTLASGGSRRRSHKRCHRVAGMGTDTMVIASVHCSRVCAPAITTSTAAHANGNCSAAARSGTSSSSHTSSIATARSIHSADLHVVDTEAEISDQSFTLNAHELGYRLVHDLMQISG